MIQQIAKTMNSEAFRCLGESNDLCLNPNRSGIHFPRSVEVLLPFQTFRGDATTANFMVRDRAHFGILWKIRENIGIYQIWGLDKSKVNFYEQFGKCWDPMENSVTYGNLSDLGSGEV